MPHIQNGILADHGPLLTVRVQSDPVGIVEVPARPNPGIVIHVGRPVSIACDRGGHRYNGTTVHGDVDIVPAGIPARWELKQSDTALIIGVNSRTLRSVAEDSGIDPARLEILNRFQVRDPQIENLGWALKTEMESGYPSGSVYLDSLATALAVLLIRRHSSDSPPAVGIKGGLSGYRLKQVLAYVDDHISERLSLIDISAVAGLSISQLSSAFRASMGQSVHQYVTRRRVERACDLLRDRQSVTEVAFAAGFAHASHLARQMRRTLGVSPRDVARTLSNKGSERPSNYLTEP